MIEKIAKYLTENNLTVAMTESCTGGLLSSAFTDVSGSSAFIHLNFVTYSNEAKEQILGVKHDTLEKYGAVSEQTAKEMAEGLNRVTGADICISTTGIAGPTGGTDEKPVGLMYNGIFINGKCNIFKIVLPPQIPRTEMKKLFVEKVLQNLYGLIN